MDLQGSHSPASRHVRVQRRAVALVLAGAAGVRSRSRSRSRSGSRSGSGGSFPDRTRLSLPLASNQSSHHLHICTKSLPVQRPESETPAPTASFLFAARERPNHLNKKEALPAVLHRCRGRQSWTLGPTDKARAGAEQPGILADMHLRQPAPLQQPLVHRPMEPSSHWPSSLPKPGLSKNIKPACADAGPSFQPAV